MPLPHSLTIWRPVSCSKTQRVHSYNLRRNAPFVHTQKTAFSLYCSERQCALVDGSNHTALFHPPPMREMSYYSSLLGGGPTIPRSRAWLCLRKQAHICLTVGWCLLPQRPRPGPLTHNLMGPRATHIILKRGHPLVRGPTPGGCWLSTTGCLPFHLGELGVKPTYFG